MEILRESGSLRIHKGGRGRDAQERGVSELADPEDIVVRRQQVGETLGPGIDRPIAVDVDAHGLRLEIH